MSRRSYLLLVVLIAVCLAAIGLSVYAANRLPPTVLVPRGREPIPFPGTAIGPIVRAAPFGPHPAGWRGVVAAVASFCFLYLVSVLVLFIFPRRLRLARDGLMAGRGQVFRLLGIGALAGVAALLLMILGAFAFVASPVSLLLLAGLLLAVWGGMVAVALAIGRGISRRAGVLAPSAVFDLTVGILIVFTLGRVPVAGWIFLAILGSLALGVVIDSRFGAGGAWSLAEFDAGEEAMNEQA
jgi:hypothetical protein